MWEIVAAVASIIIATLGIALKVYRGVSKQSDAIDKRLDRLEARALRQSNALVEHTRFACPEALDQVKFLLKDERGNY